MINKRWGMVLLAVLGAVLAADTSYRITVNGVATSLRAVTLQNQIYIPLAAVKELVGSRVSGNTVELFALNAAQGGANERPSVEGCVNQWVFNGVWRLRVLRMERVVAPFSGAPGYAVALELRNGSTRTLSPAMTGWDGNGRGIDLVADDGSKPVLDVGDYQVGLVFKEIPQAASLSTTLKFYYPSGTDASRLRTPNKLLLEINPQVLRNNAAMVGNLSYSVANPSFRIKLDCN